MDKEPDSSGKPGDQPASIANVTPTHVCNDGSTSGIATLLPTDDPSPAESTHAHMKSALAYQSGETSPQGTKSNAKDMETIDSDLKELFQGDATKRIYADQFQNLADKTCNGRRFFITRRGFMGIGPLRAETGRHGRHTERW